MKGHWSRTCCTLKHLVDVYQASIKGKEFEMNFIDSNDQVDLTHLDVSDFFENPNEKIDHLIGDGNVCYDKTLCFYLVLCKYVYFVIIF